MAGIDHRSAQRELGPVADVHLRPRGLRAFAIDVPIDAVESVNVYKTAYRAEFGRFSGGLTSVETKPPAGQFHFEVNDLLPTPRVKSGHMVGIADDSPRLSVTGPILLNRLNFSESITYEVDKQPVRGLAWPHNETKTEEVNVSYVHTEWKKEKVMRTEHYCERVPYQTTVRVPVCVPAPPCAY